MFESKSGKFAPIPWTREEAKAIGATRYMFPEEQKRCGKPIRIGPWSSNLFEMKVAPCACAAKYTETGECMDCTGSELWHEVKSNPDKYPTTAAMAKEMGLDYVYTQVPCKEGPHLRTSRINTQGDGCATCQDAPSPRQVAEETGELTYTPKTVCKGCKTKSPRYTATGHCIKCEKDKGPEKETPRQVAIREGRAKYMPDTVCTKCGEQALRRVHDGSCDGCKAAARGVALQQPNEMTLDLMITIPEGQTVDLETAKVMGLNAFRPTGQDWLYIETLKIVRVAV